MEIGVFIPIGNNGWLLSENAPQYKPSFDLNKEVVLRAEKYGFDFALSMIKLRGFGGKTEFWDHNLESFTLMAGLASVTTKIKLFATAATLVMPPAIVARMASTIDSISHGRFGLNVITGWQRPEYSQMGLWPGDEYFARRYDYLAEYVQVLRELWGKGQSDFKGDFFKMDDCRLSPSPAAEMKLICAGQSDAGLAFTARYADYNFGFGKGRQYPGRVLVFEHAAGGRHRQDRPSRRIVSALHGHRGRDRRGGACQMGTHQGRGRSGSDRVARATKRDRQVFRGRRQCAANGGSDVGREYQYGHVGGLL
jgi:pyrimidine utilization protein A